MAPSQPRSLGGSADPRQIGRYEIISPLGVGGMARVFLGLQRGPGGARKLLAIKQVRPEIAADENFLAMFVDEARIALRLSHPNVVTTFEVVAEPGEFFMVLEYLEGQSLAQILRRVGRENMPRAEHVHILRQAMLGLHYAHTLADFDDTPLGVVHRDVSPSNVFITYEGEVKLLDFGIAKVSGALAQTQQGMIKGKLGYASPEQCLGKPVDARSDVYAVGILLWEALAQRRRAIGETAAAVVQARVLNSEQRLEEVWPAAPPELGALVQRALALEPEDRFSSALELERALAPFHGGTGQAELAAFMAEYFDADRKAQRRALEEYLGAPRSRPPVSASFSTREGVIPEDMDQRSGTRPGAVSGVSAMRAKGSAMRRTLILAAAGAVLLGLGLLQLRRGADQEAPAPLPSTADHRETPPLSSAAEPAVSALPAAEPAAVEPLEIVPRSPAGAARPRVSIGARPVRPSSPLHAGTDVAARPESAAPSAEAAVEPGQDLRVRGKPRAGDRGIDEKDPYSK